MGDEVDSEEDTSTTASPADVQSTSQTENGGSNSMILAVLASSVVLVLCCVCACGCIFAGCVLYQQKAPSKPNMPEPSAPRSRTATTRSTTRCTLTARISM